MTRDAIVIDKFGVSRDDKPTRTLRPVGSQWSAMKTSISDCTKLPEANEMLLEGHCRQLKRRSYAYRASRAEEEAAAQ